VIEADVENFSLTALDLVPRDWLSDLPGEILVAAHAAIVTQRPPHFPFAVEEIVAARIGSGPIQVFSDFRADPDSFTRFVMVAGGASEALVGRTLQQLFEVETYRLMALLAYPLALQTNAVLTQLESEIDAAAAQVVDENGVASDRNLVNKLAALAGRAEKLAGQTNFRVAASRAYYGLVGARIASWNEQAVDGRPTLGEFMERRLAPAMRTSGAVAERLQGAIDRIARTVQVLNTRVEVASEIVNVDLLASMDKRSKVQLRLQETVEGLSIVAVSYYALSLLKVAFDGLAEVVPRLNPTVATALSVPVVLYLVWHFLRRVRKNVFSP
jgi:uncharacterized membrane-anchored protein